MSANKKPGSIVVVIQHSAGCVATAIMPTFFWRLEVMRLINLLFFFVGHAPAINYEVLMYFYQKTSLSYQT